MSPNVTITLASRLYIRLAVPNSAFPVSVITPTTLRPTQLPLDALHPRIIWRIIFMAATNMVDDFGSASRSVGLSVRPEESDAAGTMLPKVGGPDPVDMRSRLVRL